MRLENIRDKYPNGFQVFYKWWQNVSLFKNRDLYEFFDSHGIILCICYRRINKKYYWEIFDGKYWIGCQRGKDFGIFDTRTETEDAGFTKCFEILENQIERENNETKEI